MIDLVACARLRGLAGLACLVAVACSFSGAGHGAGLGNLGDEGDDGDDGDDGSGGDGSSVGDDDHGTGESGGAGDQGPGDGGDDGGSDDETGGDPPVVGGAQIVFVLGAAIDLGPIDAADPSVLPAITLRNDGDLPAEGLSGGALVAPLSWAGGAFPGTGGTCTGTLEPDATCDIVLAPIPAPFGVTSQTLTVDYQDSGVAESASATVDAIVIGASGELVQNGAFAEGSAGSAPPSWAVESGSWYTTNNQGVSDSRSVFAGSASVGTTVVLSQTIDLSMWADTIASAGLGVRVDGWAHAQSGDIDQWVTVLTELDGAGGVVLTHATEPSMSADWSPFQHEYPLAPQTQSVRIELRCVMNNGQNCNVWFDAVTGHVMYPPPPL